VVVECRGKVTTKTGRRYDNTYCWVCRLAGGKIVSLTEYMDTQLVATALEAPVDEVARAGKLDRLTPANLRPNTSETNHDRISDFARFSVCSLPAIVA
jgi:hypothetical protein